MFLQHAFTLITYSHGYIDVYIFVQHVFTLHTREFIMSLQCAYQLQIRCIYSIYTITGTHMYMHTCKVNTHLLATCLRARIDPTLTDLPYMVRFSLTISVGP